jgi:hypothetical protein
MQWFKHSKGFRNTAAIKYIEGELGDSGYARACKLLEVISEINTKKPFDPRLIIEPPYTYRWLAIELGCMDEDQAGNRFPDEAETVKTLWVFERAGLIQILEGRQFFLRRPDGVPQSEGEERPYELYVPGMKEWVEWHDVKNRNKPKKKSNGEPEPESNGDAAPARKPRFAGIGTPGGR